MSPSPPVHEASGDGEDPSLQGVHGGLLQIRTSKATHGAGEVVGHHGQRQPGGVCHELARRQVGESGALELGDPLLDDRVAAVVGLDLTDVSGPVGDERVVVLGREQRQLAAGSRPDPAHDKAHRDGVLAGERGVGGLGDVGTGDLRG